MKFSDVERIFCSYDQGYYWSQQKISATSPRRSTIFVGYFGSRTNAFWSAVRMGRISISILQRNTFSFTQFRHPKSVGDISRNTVVVKRCSTAKDTSRGQYYLITGACVKVSSIVSRHVYVRFPLFARFQLTFYILQWFNIYRIIISSRNKQLRATKD